MKAPDDDAEAYPSLVPLSGYPFYSTLFYSCLGAFLKCSRPRAPFLTQMLTLLDGQVKSAQPCFEYKSVSCLGTEFMCQGLDSRRRRW